MMQGDEFEGERDEAAPIDMLAAYFEAHGWPFEHASEDEIVATTQGSWAQYELRAIWREQDQVLQLLALPDIRVSDEKRATIYETLGLINEQLWLGHFELWSNSGLVLFRNGALLGSGRSEEHTSELQSLMRTSYAVFCLKKKIIDTDQPTYNRVG